jgi:cellulose synthase/poly-beta-1,6-N-acetylglucosamine synthase-like glycosyltransferase/peptidoglycan/xylan/chitin deacetylase (PgdA/CDA1 family)/spore germination protein YaaH
MPPISGAHFVFLDKQGKRWPRLRLFMLISGITLFLCSIVFVQSLFVMTKLTLPPSVQQLKNRLKVLQKQESLFQALSAKPLWLEFKRAVQSANANASPSTTSAPLSARKTFRKIRLGFYTEGDTNSMLSFRAHADQLTHVCTDWLTMTDGSGTLIVKAAPEIEAQAIQKGIVFLPILNNLVGDSWQPEAVEGVANGPEERRNRFVSELIDALKKTEARGVIVDWGQVDPTYRPNITRLIQYMAASLHAENLELWLRIPMGRELKVFDLEVLSADVDRFIATLHDENSESDMPGPIASQNWFDGWLQTVTAYGKPSQWIVEMGSYGYDWGKDEKKAETIGFGDIMTRAGRSGLQTCEVKAPLYNPGFSYTDAGIEHTVWFLDAATFTNQFQTARNLGVGGIGIYPLGSEDPAIWTALSMRPFDITPETLEKIGSLKAAGATHVGVGEFLTIEDNRSNGIRRLQLDSDGKVTEVYEQFPNYLTVSHQGKGKEDEVAISFDDGPDPEWTPQILDILKDKGVKASFFVVGSTMEENPALVRRIVAEGHEIGVHTYTHPNLSQISEERARIELNATQRLIETLTGRSTILFRPPYNADSRPTSFSEILPLKISQEMGYLTVAEDIDPEDWAEPGVDQILERVKQYRQAGGNIVLLHDAGGDRSQTVAALPLMLDYLDDRGDHVVSLARLLGESPEVVMPVVQEAKMTVTRMISSSGFRILHAVTMFLWSFMIVATFLVVVRTLAVTVLALIQRHKFSNNPASDFSPSISVLIAAYNEEKVIEKTLQSVLSTPYSGNISVWVVDDGSSDRTAHVVETFSRKDSRVRLIRQTNQGKALALQNGLAAITDDIVVMLDADTQFQPETLMRLVQPLQDSQVAAVSGHAKVGNLRSFIARCQALEYICGFNLDRRAYHYLNCITVVPGAICAVRKSAVFQVGGICTDTLAEDTDLTLALHRHGYRIAYVSNALALTEAPETIATLATQRFRWAFGTMQCLWKHRDMVMNPRFKALGCFSLPGIWFFQVILVALAPVIDALMIASLLFGKISPLLFSYFGIFLLMDFLLAALACLMEHEPLRRAWLILPMRFVYRPLLSWVIWKSLIKAAKGAWVSWGKLERTASVTG